MDKDAKIFVAGHRGMVGSAVVRRLQAEGFANLILRPLAELDLTRQSAVEEFFSLEQPEYVFLAAARVGGILANSTYKADFIYDNIMIAANVIDASYRFGVRKLLNLGSTCIYPKHAPQPLKEEYLLTGPLEETNDAYAIAKIAALKLCRHYNEQHGTNFLSVMPTNLYGLNDNYDFNTSHFLPALIRKFHLARCLADGDIDAIREDFRVYGSPFSGDAEELSEFEIAGQLQSVGLTPACVTLWGSGNPLREFLFADDLADACVDLMTRCDAADLGEFVNVGTGEEHTIAEYARRVRDITGYKGDIAWDTSKPDGTPRKLSDISRLRALGWTPKTSLQQGLREVYEDYKNGRQSFS